MRNYLLFATIFILGSGITHAQIEDDIYYNPKKSTQSSKSGQSKTNSNYIANFQDMDVDAYNMRGQYYSSPVDTIGADTEAGQDFVYTTQIQKYYNPTIVVDNQNLLADVLENSYGNVNVEFNINGIPTFGPYYSYYPSRWGNLYWDLTPGWSISWGWSQPWWGSAYSWGWGPAWGYGSAWAWSPGWNWGPSWNWGWGPSLGWGGWAPGWVPPRPGHAYYADYRPGGNRPVGANGGWAQNTRPGGNYSQHRPVGNGNRPYYGTSGRPSGSSNSGIHSNGNVNQGGHRQVGQGAYQGNNSSRPGNSGVINNSGSAAHRNSNNTTVRRESSTSTQRRENTTNNSYTQHRNSSSSSGSYNRAGGFGGSSSGGHRTSGGGGGGGSRGGHR